MSSIEETKRPQLDFSKLARLKGSDCAVIPVAVQDAGTGEVILVAYTNEYAFKKAVETRRLILWSTSRGELWEKGGTSGNTFDLLEVYVNCEQNSLLYKVRAARGGICHTKNSRGQARNCFYRRLNLDTMELENADP